MNSEYEIVSRIRLVMLEDELAKQRWGLFADRLKTWFWPVATLLVVGAALWEILKW